MRRSLTRRTAVLGLGAMALGVSLVAEQRGGRRAGGPAVTDTTIVLGRPTDRSITLSILAPQALDAFVEYGTSSEPFTTQTAVASGKAARPLEITITGLTANTRYHYRVRSRQSGSSAFDAGAEQSFMTQRTPGSTFVFGVQGDSHPERLGKMFSPELYARTLQRVHDERPDLYVMLGDDFSIENLISNGTLSQDAVDAVYARQRPFLSRMAGSTALFLVNGNHEEAGQVLLDGTANCPPVLAGIARNTFFPLPEPDGFYTGDAEPVDRVGLPRDYYAFTWGDALFVAIDFYWHSSVQVDAPPGGQGGQNARGGGQGGRGGRNANAGGRGGQGGRGGNAARSAGGGTPRDMWQVTLGDAQYAWLTKTLESSRAKYKFVFAHHVLGTGRGAVEDADFFEWGGNDRNGSNQFASKRPGWAMPIHQLFVKTGVTIFFQGHDHLFAHQVKDGVVYQETPNPADDTYTAFNDDAYRSGETLPNSGHLRVTVSPENVKVDYVRSYLQKDEDAKHKDGDVAFSYTVTARAGRH